jgi:hypothetical protein
MLGPGKSCEVACDADRGFVPVQGTAAVYTCAVNGKTFDNKATLQCQQYVVCGLAAISCMGYEAPMCQILSRVHTVVFKVVEIGELKGVVFALFKV